MRQETYRRMIAEAIEDAKKYGWVCVGYNEKEILFGSHKDLVTYLKEEEGMGIQGIREIKRFYDIDGNDRKAMYLARKYDYSLEDFVVIYSADDLEEVLGY